MQLSFVTHFDPLIFLTIAQGYDIRLLCKIKYPEHKTPR